MLVNTSSPQVITDELDARLEQFMFDRFPDLTPSASLLPLGPPVQKPVQVRVSGADTEGRGCGLPDRRGASPLLTCHLLLMQMRQ